MNKVLNNISKKRVTFIRLIFVLAFVLIIIISSYYSNGFADWKLLLKDLLVLGMAVGLAYRIIFVDSYKIYLHNTKIVFIKPYFILRLPSSLSFELASTNKVIWSYVGTRAATMRLTFHLKDKKVKGVSFDLTERELIELFRFFKESEVSFSISGKRKNHYQNLYDEVVV